MNLLLLLLWFAVCADQDARCRRVSNVLTFGGAIIGLLYLLINGHSWLGAATPQPWWALLLTLVLTLPGYALGRLGAGDVKLLIALALASDQVLLLGTFIGAGMTSVVWLLMRQKLWRLLARQVRARYPHLSPETSTKQPFVPFLFLGFVATLVWVH